MSRLTELLNRVKSKDPKLGKELADEFKVLSARRQFGLNFEKHKPENVELPNREVRKGDKVRVLPERGSTVKGDQRLWLVKAISKQKDKRIATIELLENAKSEKKEVDATDLIVVAEFQDYIYPGLVSTGKVERGGDKPFHTVINGENYHALKALTFTHKGKIDAIYIDPPYNTGARDWKYNNDYVESDDNYRHSKWLAFMERRLKLAGVLLNSKNSVLIITIDEKEYLRLGMLLEQLFPEGEVVMITSVISAKGAVRPGRFSRVEEHIYYVFFGQASVKWWESNMLPTPEKSDKLISAQEFAPIQWLLLRRREPTSVRTARPNQFYPIFANVKDGTIHSIGDPIKDDVDRNSVTAPKGTVAIWPLKPDGKEMLWGLTPDVLRRNWKKGFVKIATWKPEKLTGSVKYLQTGVIAKIKSGEITITGRAKDGSVIGHVAEGVSGGTSPKRVWNMPSHNAETGGTNMISALLPGRRFPFPKSLFAVEDTLRFVVADNPNAVILDFFSGSGTTAHAVMRLNKQDGGNRISFSITNNEVSAEEGKSLREEGLRPGDNDWEKWGICDFITKPRIKAAITGMSPEGKKVKGDYRYTDVFPISQGIQENAEFFTLTYHSPIAVNHNLAFKQIAPLLWMRAGSQGKRIDKLPESGWKVVHSYGLLVDLDKSTDFVKAIKSIETAKMVFIVTNDDRRFQSIVRQLPEGTEPVRLYESYLKNFQFTSE